jgi:hypothetical protein
LIGRDFHAVLEGGTVIAFERSKLKIIYLMLVFCKPVKSSVNENMQSNVKFEVLTVALSIWAS